MAEHSAYWNRIALKYSKQPVPDEKVYQTKLDKTREYLNSDAKVFEFGCGTATTAIHLAPFTKSYLATDFSEKMVEIGRAKAEASGIQNLRIECKSIESMGPHDEAFDVVIGMSILHLLQDVDGTIQRAFDMLKPGGVFVTSTACIRDVMPWFRFVAKPLRMLRIIPFVQILRVTEIEESMQSAGFECIHTWQPGPKAATFHIHKKPEK